MAVVTGQALVLKGTNGLSILLGSGPPDSTVGVDGQPGYLDTASNLLYGPRVAGSWPSVGYQFGGNLLMYAGKPPDSYGAVGNLSLDISQGFIYGPRSATAWPAQPLLALVGPQGAKGDTGPAASIPADLTANSLILQPVAGNSNAVQIAIKNSAGAILWGVDTNGNQVVGGTLNVAGAATFNGNVSAGATTVSSLSNTGNQSVAGTLSVTGTTTLGTTKVANVTFNDGTVQTTATAAAAASSAGSRSIIHMGQITNTAINANAFYGLFQVNVNASANPGSNATIYGWNFKFPFAGAVTAYQVQQNINAGTNTLQYARNGTNIGNFAVGTGTGNFAGTHAKTLYTFAAGDVLACSTSISSGSSTACHVLVVIEWT